MNPSARFMTSRHRAPTPTGSPVNWDGLTQTVMRVAQRREYRRDQPDAAGDRGDRGQRVRRARPRGGRVLVARHGVGPRVAHDAPFAGVGSGHHVLADHHRVFEAGQAWAGEATLDLFDSPTEEIARLAVHEIIGGYYRQVGVEWNGGSTLARLTP